MNIRQYIVPIQKHSQLFVGLQKINYHNIHRCFKRKLNPLVYKQIKTCTTINKLHPDYVADASLLGEMDNGPGNDKIEYTLGYKNIRAIFKHDSDEQFEKINSSASVDQLFDTLDSINVIKSSHICQSILVLWDLQRIYYESYLQNLRNDQIDYSNEFMIGLYSQQLRNHHKFNKLMELYNVNFDEFDLEQLSCCALYLKMLGEIDGSDRALNVLCECSDDVSQNAAALLRTIAALSPLKQYPAIMGALKFLPYVEILLDNCKTNMEFRMVTLLMEKLQQIITDDVLFKYKHKLKTLIHTKELNIENYQILLEVLKFLNGLNWSYNNTSEIISICMMLAPKIASMSADDILILNRVFQLHLEPANLLNAINKQTVQYINQMKSDEHMASYLKLPHLLFCQVTYATPDMKVAVEKLTSDIMVRFFPSTLPAIYKILRYLKPTNSELSDRFWKRVTELLKSNNFEDHILLRFSNKYMYFNVILSRYRCFDFEQIMVDKLMQLHGDGYVNLFPGKVSRMAAFFIAFGQSHCNNYNTVLKEFVELIGEMNDQFDYLECLILSRGLQICKIISKSKITVEMERILLKLDGFLTKRITTLLYNDLTLHELNTLVKCHINKKTRLEDDIVDTVVCKYADGHLNDVGRMSSQTVRDAAYNLSKVSVIIPSLFVNMCRYVSIKGDMLLGETLQKIIYMFYSLGYTPDDKEFLHSANEVILRDREVMNSLSLLQVCTALSYFECLNEDLVKYVFSIPFMERLDKEVANCYLKNQYPSRIRRQLMHLNRAVCLELPEHRIPWFHQSYINQMVAFGSRGLSGFERSVRECLDSLIPTPECVQTHHYTPYGYKINFLIHIDKNGIVRPAASIDKQSCNYERIAIMLLDRSHYCKLLTDDPHTKYISVTNGFVQHQTKHLELIDYRVKYVSLALWNSLHMSETDDKMHYLKQLLNL